MTLNDVFPVRQHGPTSGCRLEATYKQGPKGFAAATRQMQITDKMMMSGRLHITLHQRMEDPILVFGIS